MEQTLELPRMTPQQEYVLMMDTALGYHLHDVDKQGAPYIDHLLKVCHWLRTDDYQLKAIALGHDLIEDHGKHISYMMLTKMGFSERVVNGIRCMTKVPGESHEEYKAKVKSNRDSIRVKKQDLRHNSDLRRLKGITQKDLDRHNRYMEFYYELDALEKSWESTSENFGGQPVSE